jgi:general secretion pathway protein A
VPQYINHRLSVASEAPLKAEFSPEAIDVIYSYSNGIPRLINVVCDKSLLLGFVQGAHRIGQDIVNRSIEELEGQFSFIKS